MSQKSTVHILLATYNGDRYLTEQLDSIARQTYRDWTLTVSDDGSTDNTLTIVQNFSAQVAQSVTLLQGPRRGSSTDNFFHLLARAPANNPQDLYAFCDQDDVWYNNKLERAVLWHMRHQSQLVRLYCGRTLFVNEQLRPIGLSPNVVRQPSFGNALVQNIASGNTMVFSHAVLMAQKKIQPANSVWHDWTTYIVATALGGIVRFDDSPCLSYRQHGGNLIGSNDSFKARILRLIPLFRGRFKQWAEMNTLAIQTLHNYLDSNSGVIFNQFQQMRSAQSCIQRFVLLYKSEIRRQYLISNATLFIAVMLKRA
jgi:glycosyltransferase involved in cell wall biosynthesis